jgi:hypothetical protein
MRVASAMAEPVKPSIAGTESGAPVARDAIDPDLIKLSRKKIRVGAVTAAGVVFLCAFFLLKLSADRRFAGRGESADKVAISDVIAGKIARDSFVSLDAEPAVGNAIRATSAKGNTGMRVAPARGTSDRLWLVLPGNGWQPASTGTYAGRLRKLADLPFASAIGEYVSANPRPVFASVAAVRAGFATGKVAIVDGDSVSVTDRDRVAFELVDPATATVITTLNERFPTVASWSAALTAAGITPTHAPTVDPATPDQVAFEVATPDAVATLTKKLETASLWAARVEPLTRHYDSTWGALRASPPTGITVGTTTIPDAQIDLVGLYVARGIPADSYALLVGDRPTDYWFVMPVTIALGLIGLVFAWALVRAVRRDFLPARAA